jgi:hypothetical protein
MTDDDQGGRPALTSLTEIGRDWGLTNRELGDILTNAGYRSDGTPTDKALDENLAIVTFVGDYPRYAWSRELVGRFLEASGRKKERAWNRDGKTLYVVMPIIL